MVSHGLEDTGDVRRRVDAHDEADDCLHEDVERQPGELLVEQAAIWFCYPPLGSVNHQPQVGAVLRGTVGAVQQRQQADDTDNLLCGCVATSTHRTATQNVNKFAFYS